MTNLILKRKEEIYIYTSTINQVVLMKHEEAIGLPPVTTQAVPEAIKLTRIRLSEGIFKYF